MSTGDVWLFCTAIYLSSAMQHDRFGRVCLVIMGAASLAVFMALRWAEG